MPTSPTRTNVLSLPLLAAAVTVLLWASAFVVVRSAGAHLSPGALALGRQLAGSAALTLIVAVVAIGRRRMPRLPDGRTLVTILIWGAAWFGLYNLSLNAAEQTLDAGTTALLVNLAPMLVALLAGLLLGEGFPRTLMIGMAVAFAGVALIASTTGTGSGDLVGVLLGLTAAAIYATSAVVQKRVLARVDALTMTWLGCLAGTVCCLPFARDLSVQAAAAPAGATLGMIYLGLFPTAVAFLTWGYALSRTSAGRLAASTYLVPPLVVLLSWFLLGEVPALLALAGGALCLGGVAIATIRRSRKPSPVPRDGALSARGRARARAPRSHR